MKKHTLDAFGWTDTLAASFASYAEQGCRAGRVVIEQRELYRLETGDGEREAVLAGRLRHRATSPLDLPAVGDWVAWRSGGDDGAALIEAVLPRRSQLLRKVAGARTAEQVMAANIDTVFIVMGLDGDYNLRRVERLLTIAWESGAQPIIVLSKADLCPDVDERLFEVEGVAPGVTVLAVSCQQRLGLDTLREQLIPRQTIVLIGSSGVGKSIAQGCRFGDCTHHDEPGCAVRAAVEDGELEASRLEHLHALQKELRYLALRQDTWAQRAEKKKVAAIHKAVKRFKPRW